jgi:Flp pilus assembly protein CpaB
MATRTVVCLLAGVFVLGTILGAAGGFVLGRLRLDDTADADRVAVVVAKQEIRQGTLIKEPDLLFEVREMPRVVVPPNTIWNLTELRNKVVARTLDAGAFCTSRDFATASPASTLPEGYLAVGVKYTWDGPSIDLTGARVDVIAVMPDPQDPQIKVAKIFLQNVQVLACEDEGKWLRATLAVTPDQAEVLVRVSKDGPVHLAMRRAGDDKIR